jgi:hypothetical protein
MTNKEIQHLRARKHLKINYSKDWLLFLFGISWILSMKYAIRYAFDFFEKSQTFLFLMIMFGIAAVTFVFVMSTRLRGGLFHVKKNEHFNFNQLLNGIENESWSVIKQEDDLILIETEAGPGMNSIIILIDKDKIYYNSRPNSIRPFAYYGDWKISKKLKEILTSV